MTDEYDKDGTRVKATYRLDRNRLSEIIAKCKPENDNDVRLENRGIAIRGTYPRNGRSTSLSAIAGYLVEGSTIGKLDGVLYLQTLEYKGREDSNSNLINLLNEFII